MDENAIWSQETYLMVYDTTLNSWRQVICIVDYSDLGGQPELLQSTTLCQVKNHTYITGLQDTDSITFTANYTVSNYTDVLELAGGATHNWALFFGTGRDGVIDNGNGAFYWPGELSVWKSGQGVNEVSQFQFAISVAGDIAYNEDPFSVAGSGASFGEAAFGEMEFGEA